MIIPSNLSNIFLKEGLWLGSRCQHCSINSLKLGTVSVGITGLFLDYEIFNKKIKKN